MREGVLRKSIWKKIEALHNGWKKQRGKSGIHSGNSESLFDTFPDTFFEQTIFFLTNKFVKYL